MKNLSIIKIKTIALIIVAIFLFAITFLIFFSNSKSTNTRVNYTSKSTLSQATEENLTNKSNMYEVKSVAGELVVFMNGEEFSVLIDEIKLSSLPEADQLIIESGLVFYAYNDLIDFLENYE
ncbi:MAG: hypothetical protein R3Y33_08765 [Clostridia bacterium]